MKKLDVHLTFPLLLLASCADLETETSAAGVAPAGYNARLVNATGVPGVVAPGATYVLSVEMQNTGSIAIVRGIERFTSLNTPVRQWGFQNVSMPRPTINPGETFIIPV